MSAKESKKTYWLGIDVGATKILAVVYDQDFNMLGSKKRKTKVELGQDAVVERVLKTGHNALNDAEINADQLSGVGIGCPGALDLVTGTVVVTNNLSWKNVPIQKILEKAFGVPVAVTNDVDAGTLGEYVHGAGKGARSVLGIFPGTGIGGGFVYEGKILHGRNSSCMEVGHIQVLPEGPLCGCGRNGCLEAVAGRLAISTAAAAAVLRGQAPWLQEMVGSDPVNIRSGALASAVENGDAVIEKLIVDSCNHIGVVLGGLVNLLAPDIIVIGGGLAEAMPDLYKKSVWSAMKPKVMDALKGTCEIKIAELKDHAAALGAAASVMKKGSL